MNRDLFAADGATAAPTGASPPAVPVGDLAGRPIRLAELSVHNWGSFNGLHTARIDPEGTLVTGDNGSGKTTLIDGLMALLLPSGRAAFNVAAAQGDRTDRTLLSYMRGSFGAAHDGAATRVTSSREAGVVTGLRALYRVDGGAEITLVALFWIAQSTNALSDVKRCYAIARRNLALVDVLHAFGEGNARAMKQWMKADPAITCLDESFSDYQALYRQLLHMDNRNAPALLSRALGLKRIDDLTTLIRELVLEPSTVRDDARTVVAEFADLVSVHDTLVDARARRDALARLPELDATLRRTAEAIEALRAERDALPVHVARRALELWERRVETLEAALAEVGRALGEAELAAEALAERVERFHEAYLGLGGNQVETLRRDLGLARERLEEIVSAAGAYQRTARELDLPDALDEATFEANRARATEALARIGEDLGGAQDGFAGASASLSEVQRALRQNREEAAGIAARPDSNVPLPFQRLRDELLESLSLEPGECRFLGELVDVLEAERPWRGAIERALGGLRTTLAVPETRFRLVTGWLNARHTGLHVRVQVIDPARVPSRPPEFLDDGFLKKLAWREHPWREWLKHHLQRFDLRCVDGTAALDATPFSMTREGLIHKERGRFEKKDRTRVDDRRDWCLGFSNTARLALLETDRARLETELAAAAEAATAARASMDALGATRRRWEALEAERWARIDVPGVEARRDGIVATIEALERAGGDLACAREDWDGAKAEQREAQRRVNDLSARRGAAEQSLDQARADAGRTRERAAEALDEAMAARLGRRLERRFGELGTEDLPRVDECRRALDADIGAELESRTREQRGAENAAIGTMSSFRSKERWQPIVADWGTGLDALADYLAHLEHLEREGLPALVESFGERLNKHATQSLARIMTRLDAEREDILERMDTINRVLRRTEFKPGSHLRIGTRKERFAHVVEFERKLQRVLGEIGSDDHDARFRHLAEVVETLDQASSPGSARAHWSLQLLDPRHQMTFYAEELDDDTLGVRDVLESSSGKSGGEKEAFAGTIVAASLAYVLTPDGADRPVYSTVFLDEAFSNTAEMVSRRVLRVFRELGLHVNLITPYKNLNLARESARSLLIAERDAERHDSRLSEVTWERIDERLATARGERAAERARALGIELGAAPASEPPPEPSSEPALELGAGDG